jgi:saccharopine dehydrogenase (NAD+, L-lysine forming)
MPVAVSEDSPLLTQFCIDHMPSLLPRETSKMFSQNVLAILLALDRRHEGGVWTRAEKIYKKIAELPIELQNPG